MERGNISQDGLGWEIDISGKLQPTWTKEPDILKIRDIVIRHTPLMAFETIIELYAENKYHKTYRVRSSNWDHCEEYMLYAYLPVYPLMKTMSEVSTMEFIRRNTSIPAPRVIACSPSSGNGLGFEWILIARPEGVPLTMKWDRMSPEAKHRLTRQLADMFTSLYKIRFMLAGIARPEDYMFDVYRVVLPSYFEGRRMQLDSHRGPYLSGERLLQAEIELEMRHLQAISQRLDDEYYCRVDAMLAEHREEIRKLYGKFLRLMPKIFPREELPTEIKVLCHRNLTLGNIFVDRKTLRITSVLGWECASVIPPWKFDFTPSFLKEADLFYQCQISPAFPLEITPSLTRTFEDIINPLIGADGEKSEGYMRKRGFVENLEKINEGQWVAAKWWVDEMTAVYCQDQNQERKGKRRRMRKRSWLPDCICM
ncbi:hypothetical protein BDY21DRAFT_408438 [Lineolata rhizophorae]|uniref:Aminoglycoside phosphotransferase domain-containing protein n=1 Tax=Lineolata rhizophorae TaxID=578093 RepID=A0A6A6P8E4_9PEZI|nr:hypothetical protein BDY21DRAFT_408438 [Lineolata rhizophorae]